ncbi:mitochondrial carrier protein, putative [Hepatocystis sp. ex Piliocolobus tephrosceles]|nr:mitochondrial carrier protein, putative [Hepatocystis sp. ex Piliocolobus tephrosceles]
MSATENGVKNKTLIYNDLLRGAVLHSLETATLGLPFEVWKTRMCIHRNENTIRSFINIYNKGVSNFYGGFFAKLVESSSKGAVLLLSKEQIIKACNSLNINNTVSGFIGGACGGICQSLVMTPCTFFITNSIDNKVNYKEKIVHIIKTSGITTLYRGNVAMCFRQGTNWASRQGITEWVRNKYIQRKKKIETENVHSKNKNIQTNEHTHLLGLTHSQNSKTSNEKNLNNLNLINDKKNHNINSQLSISEEIICGIIGGTLSVWNNPFDVVRVYMQNNANKNIKSTFLQSIRSLYNDGGILYLYKGVIPRCFLCIWQTLFMVTGIKILEKYV